MRNILCRATAAVVCPAAACSRWLLRRVWEGWAAVGRQGDWVRWGFIQSRRQVPSRRRVVIVVEPSRRIPRGERARRERRVLTWHRARNPAMEPMAILRERAAAPTILFREACTSVQQILPAA